jgi:phage gpG-like protein
VAVQTAHFETLALFGGGGTISFDWAPNPAIVAAKLDIAAARLEHMAEPLGLSREVAIADVEERFATETAPDGSAWTPWATSYAERTTASSILTLTGAMRDAVTSRGAWPIDGNDLFFSGSGAPERWAWHQSGAVRSRGVSEADIQATKEMHARGLFGEGITAEQVYGNVLPARPFIGLSEDAKFQVIDIFDAWVAGTIGAVVYPSRGGYTRQVFRTSTGRFASGPG